MAGDSEDVKVKPEGSEKSEVISVIVKDQSSGEVHFKVKPATRFAKIFKAYADKKGIDVASIRFLYDGQQIKGHETPAEVGIEDGDVLDCFLEQVGGAQR